jgi:glycosyltransferase involved in cell wall biosynthesis
MILPRDSKSDRCRIHGDCNLSDPSRPTARPFFSVVTASLNNGFTIATALESVKNQTCRGVEHIVIDGGSTDETLEILKRYETKYRLRWISEPDRGLADAMNKGVHAARGHYVIFIHTDDALIEPGILEWIYKQLETQKYDICCFPILFKCPDGNVSRAAPIRMRGWHRFRNTIRHQGCFVHRRLHEQIGYFNTTYAICMDYDFFYRALQAGASIRYFDRTVSVMGGKGVSSNPRFLLKRLKEEQTVQELNEQNPLWRAAQRVFRRLYVPYKTRRFGRQLKRRQL